MFFFISFFGGIIGLINIPMFFFRFYEFSFWGFKDFTQFRSLYNPMGFLSNEWVTMMLVLLPFPIIAYFINFPQNTKSGSTNNYSIINYILIFIILIIVFNILISFSRAGYLALLTFYISLNIFFILNKFYSIKKILFVNLTFIILIILFCISFYSNVHSTLYSTDSHRRSTVGRIDQWRNAINIIKEYPFCGIGSKNYALISNTFQEKKIDASFSGRINNSYLHVLIEKGFIGFLLWGGCFCYIFCKILCAKNRRDCNVIKIITISSALSIMIREFFFSSLFYNSGILFLFGILLFSNNFETKKIQIINVNKYAIYAIIISITIFGIFSYLSYENNVILYDNYISRLEEGHDTKDPLPNKSMGNSLLVAAKGLAIVKNNFNTNFRDCMIHGKRIECNLNDIKRAIKYYKDAIDLNPFDGSFQHNIGWLYYMQGDIKKSLKSVSNAIALSPNTALYHISKGIMIEAFDIEGALDEYQLAIMLSPDICDSYFFYDLKIRFPQKTKLLLEEAFHKLSEIQIRSYSSIIEAKIGKILLVQNNIDKAYKTLLEVSRIHPNLNRPWYYLGCIENIKKRQENVSQFYAKAIFLDNNDYLPFCGMAEYYAKIHNNKQEKIYRKIAKEKWRKKKSFSAISSERMYYLSTINDNIIPNGLLDYISPILDIEHNDKN